MVNNLRCLLKKAIPSAKDYITDHETTVRILPPKIESVGPRGSFPLSFLHSNNYVAKRTALIGYLSNKEKLNSFKNYLNFFAIKRDAIHKIHPLAGQGVNLGFGDVVRLLECLRENVATGAEIGAWNYLKKYESERQKEVFIKLAGIDGLNRLFTDYNYPSMLVQTPLVALRTIGLTASNRLVPLKKFYIQQAMN